MDNEKFSQLREEIKDYLKKESEISKLLEENIASLIGDLEKLEAIIK